MKNKFWSRQSLLLLSLCVSARGPLTELVYDVCVDALRRILCQVGLERGPEGENSSLVDTLMLCDSKMWKGEEELHLFSS